MINLPNNAKERSICHLITSEAFLHSRCYRSQVSIHLAGRRTKNQAHNSLTSNMNVLESAKNVNLRVGQYHACSAGILDRELCLAVLSGDSANSST